MIVVVFFSCSEKNSFVSDGIGGQVSFANGCEGVFYFNWQTSLYALPFKVGESYTIGPKSL